MKSMKSLSLEEFALSESISIPIDDDDTLFAGLSPVPTPPETLPDEDVVEDLLSAKLMDGYALLEKPCPRCLIPLVKKPVHPSDISGNGSNNNKSSNNGESNDNNNTNDKSNEREPRIVTSSSIDAIPKPIKGIPYCVTCASYVVTNNGEIEILAKLKYLGADVNSSEGHILPASTDAENGDAVMIDTNALLELGVEDDHLATPSLNGSNGQQSPSGWVSQQSSRTPTSILFQQSFSSMLKQKRMARRDSAMSSSSSVASSYHALKGKRLTGMAASQGDLGVEMKLEGASIAPSLAPSMADDSLPSRNNSMLSPTSKTEERDDTEDNDNASTLWKFIGSSASNGLDREVELREVPKGEEGNDEEEGSTATKQANLDILRHESSEGSEPSRRANGMPPRPPSSPAVSTSVHEDTNDGTTVSSKNTPSSNRPPDESNIIAEETQEDSPIPVSPEPHQEYELGSSDDNNMIIVSDSIHYIETEKDKSAAERTLTGKDPPHEADANTTGVRQSSSKIEVETVAEESSDDDAVVAVEREDKSDKTDKTEKDETTQETQLESGSDTADSGIKVEPPLSPFTSTDQLLERTLAWEKERLKLGNSTTDTEEHFTLEDLYATSKSGIDALGREDATSDSGILLQQQIEKELLKSADSDWKTPEPDLQKIERMNASEVTEATTTGKKRGQVPATRSIPEEVLENETKEDPKEIPTPEDRMTDEDVASLVASLAATHDHELFSRVGIEKVAKDNASKHSSPTATTAASASAASKGSVAEDETMQEYAVRREIATKVLGAKMLQGYSLKESQCDQCGMPQMEFKSIVHCVVCPVLARKAKKELRKIEKLKKQGYVLEDENDAKSVEEAIVDQVLQKHSEESTARSVGEEKHNKKSILSLLADQESIKSSVRSILAEDGSGAGRRTIRTLLDEEEKEEKVKENRMIALLKEVDCSHSIKSILDEVGLVEKEMTEEKEADSLADSNKPSKSKAKEAANSRDMDGNTKELETAAQRKISASLYGEASESDKLNFKDSYHGGLPPKGAPKKAKTADKIEADSTLKSPKSALESSSSNDSWICVASKAPSNIKSADSRRKQLDAYEKALLEEAATRRAEMKRLLKDEKAVKGGDKQPELIRKKDEALRAEEMLNDQLKLIIETKRLETMERMRLANEIEFKSPQESLLAVFALQEERKRLRKEATRQKDIRVLEAARREAELETVRQAAKLKAARKEAEAEATRQAAKLKDARRKAEIETKRLEEEQATQEAGRVEDDQAARAAMKKQQERAARKLEKEQAAWEAKRIEDEKAVLKEKKMNKQQAAREARRIAELENEAKQQAEEAKVALAKAKAALEDVNAGRKDGIAAVIAQGEADTVAETEALVRAEAEDYHETKSASSLWNERWETLRLEGRSVMTRRLIAGWTMLPQYCKGSECQSSPLLRKGGKIECVVCGGSGNGNDGAYETPENASAYAGNESSLLDSSDFPADISTIERTSTTGTSKAIASEVGGSMLGLLQKSKDASTVASDIPSVLQPSKTKLSMQSVQQIHEDFEEKRRRVSKEIGKRMLQGWTLLDMSCPNCVMPLLTDEEGENEICVLCGVVGKMNNDGEEDDGGCDMGFDHARAGIKHFNDNANEYCGSEKARINDLASQTTAFMSVAKKSIEDNLDCTQKDQLVSSTKAFMDRRRMELEQNCDHALDCTAEQELIAKSTKAFMDSRRMELEKNCDTDHLSTLHDMQEKFAETKYHLNNIFKEGETAIGKQLQETRAYILQKPVVEDVVAIMSDAPCSPRTLDIQDPCSPKSTFLLQNKDVKAPYGLGLPDDLGSLDNTRSSFSVNDMDLPRFHPAKAIPETSHDDSATSAHHKSKPEEAASFQKIAVNAVATKAAGGTANDTPDKFDQGLKKKREQNMKKKHETESSFEDLANQLSKADEQHRADRGEVVPSLSEEDTLGTVDSMQPMCDDSIVEDSKPSPRQKQVKKGAAAVALEMIKEKRSKGAVSMAETGSNTEDQADGVPVKSFSFCASNRVLKSLTIDTSAVKNAPETPMSPRTPKTATSARSGLRSSPRASASPRNGASPSPRSPRSGSPSKKYTDYNQRLHHLLAENRSPSNSSKFRGTKSTPSSPQKARRGSPDYLINSIAGRKSPAYFQNHTDPPAMVSNHVIGASGRRVARDPEDRSIIEDDQISLSSKSPRRKSFSGMLSPGGRSPSPRSMSSPRSFSFTDSPASRVRKTKEDNESVTLVIPKDFDVTNDAQLRDLILAAKKVQNPSPSSRRLILEGRIKHMGDTEIIDVIDLELSDDENMGPVNSRRQLQIDPANDSGYTSAHAPSPGEKADRLPNLRQSPQADSNDIVVARMHPPSPGESPFNPRPVRKKPRPKVTPESMSNRTRLNKPRSSPTGGTRPENRFPLSPANSDRAESPKRDAPGSGSGSAIIKLDNVDHFFGSNSHSHSTDSSSGKDRPDDRHTVLANMSFSSSGESTRNGHSNYTGTSISKLRSADNSIILTSYSKDSNEGASAASGSAGSTGLPPVSPRKGSRRGSRSANDSQLNSIGEGETASGRATSPRSQRQGDSSTVVSRDSGFETGVTIGRSSSRSSGSDHSGSHRSKYQQPQTSSSSDVEGDNNVVVLNSASQGSGGFEVATASIGSPHSSRRTPRSRRLAAAANKLKERSATRGAFKGNPSEVLSVNSTTFDGIISRIDTCKSKLTPNANVKEGLRSQKMASLIGKLTVAAADVSTAGESSVDDDNLSGNSSRHFSNA